MPLTLALSEPVKDRLFHPVGDAGPRILNGYHHRAVFSRIVLHPDRDPGIRSAELDGVPDEVRKDLREQVVRQDLHRGVHEQRDLCLRNTVYPGPDHAADGDRLEVGRFLVNPPDGRDVLENPGALSDAPLEFPCIQRGVVLQHIEQEIAVEVRDVLCVFKVMGHDIKVEVRLTVGRLQPLVEHAPENARTDLPCDRLKQAALFVFKPLFISAP